MPFRHIFHDKAHRFQKTLGLVAQLLTMLHGTGRMIGQNLARGTRGLQLQCHKIFTDIFCQRRHTRGFLSISRIMAEHEAVIFHRGATARCGDENRIQAAAISFRQPQIDIAAGET